MLAENKEARGLARNNLIANISIRAFWINGSAVIEYDRRQNLTQQPEEQVFNLLALKKLNWERRLIFWKYFNFQEMRLEVEMELV